MTQSALPVDEFTWLRNLLNIERLMPGSVRPNGEGGMHELARTFAAKNGRRFVYPAREPFDIQSLLLYAPVTWRARLMKRLLPLAMRAGVERYLLPSVKLPLLSGQGSGLIDYLAEVTESTELRVAVALGTPGPQRKPVLLLMDKEGAILGFAKIASNALTNTLVTNEHSALQLLASLHLHRLRTPGVVHFGRYRGNAVLVTESLKALHSPYAQRLSQPHIRSLLELAQRTVVTASFNESPFRASLDERLHQAALHSQGVDTTIVAAAVRVLCSALRDTVLPWSFQLGDFAPWNTALEPGGAVAVIDLEYACAAGLPGTDLFHFVSATGRPSRSTVLLSSRTYETVASYFDQLNVPRELIAFLHLAYLIDLHLFRITMWRDVAMTRSARQWFEANDARMTILLRSMRRSRQKAVLR